MYLVWDVEPPTPLEEKACSRELKSVSMPSIEVEEEEICVGSLKLHYRHLPSNPTGSHVLVRNLKMGTVKLCLLLKLTGDHWRKGRTAPWLGKDPGLVTPGVSHFSHTAFPIA